MLLFSPATFILHFICTSPLLPLSYAGVHWSARSSRREPVEPAAPFFLKGLIESALLSGEIGADQSVVTNWRDLAAAAAEGREIGSPRK